MNELPPHPPAPGNDVERSMSAQVPPPPPLSSLSGPQMVAVAPYRQSGGSPEANANGRVPMHTVFDRSLTWKWWDALIALGISFLLQLLIVVLVGVVAGATNTELDGEALAANAPLLAVSSATMVVSTLFWIAVRCGDAGVKTAFATLLGPNRPSWVHVAKGIGYGLVGWFVFQVGLGALLQGILLLLGQETPEVQEGIQTAIRSGGLNTAVMMLGVAVIAPIGEELLFRGMLFQALGRFWNGWIAAVVSGAAFAVVHVEPLVMAVTFPLGVMLAFSLRREGSLIVPMVAHAVFNSISMVLLFSLPM